MEEDEVEMDVEELQVWIRDQVEKAELISPAVLQKFNEIHHLLESRQNLTEQMLHLCQSLTACENIVEELYSGLGWEFEDEDSNEASKPPSNGHSPPLSVSSVNLLSPSPGGQTTELPKTQKMFADQKSPFILEKMAAVALRRLSTSQLAKFKVQNSPVLPKGIGDDHMPSKVDSNGEDSQITDQVPVTKKKRKLNHKSPKLNEGTTKRIRTDETGRARGSSTRNARKISSPGVNPGTLSNATKQPGRQMETAKTSAARSKPPTPPSKPEKPRTAPASVKKTLKGGEENKEKQAANASGVTSAKTKDPAPPLPPPEEPTPNTSVLARKARLHWEPGKILKVVTKGDGQVKYKIDFETKGKGSLPGHHIAFKSSAKVDQLDIGSRVVVQRGEEFLPGILGEVPSRKNRQRFLVFTDNGAAVYAGLPLLHLVCRPLEDPLDDIQDKNHRAFMKQYLKDWPNPPQSHYKVGQVMKAEHQGTQQDCRVLLVDSSLLQVVFQSDQHTEWIYRGCLRLEYMQKLRRVLSKMEQ